MIVTARRTGVALTLLATTQFLLILDAAILNVALPTIGAELRVDPARLSWVVNAYALAFGGFLLLGGRLGDLHGPKRLFLGGVGLFTLASAAGALSPSAGWLVGARGLQGLGAALAAPGALALVLGIFPGGPERNRAIGVFGAMAGSGGATGLILGGTLTEWLGWQSVLWINVPVGLAVVIAAYRVIPDQRRPRIDNARFDLLGALLVTGTVIALVYGIIARSVPWIVASVVLLAVFIRVETTSPAPLVPLRVFAMRRLRAANVAALLTAMSMFPMWFLSTLYLQRVLGFGPIQAGLGTLPITVTLIVVNTRTSRVIARFGTRTTLATGLAIAAAGLFWFSRFEVDSGWLRGMLGPSMVTGVGLGLAFVAGTAAAVSDAPDGQAGLASGLVNTAQQLGGAIGLAILISVAAHYGTDSAASFTDGLSAGLLGSSIFALLGATLTLLLMPREPHPHEAPAA